MNHRLDDEGGTLAPVFWASFLFGLVYLVIHVGVNACDSETLRCDTSGSGWLTSMLGPAKISISSSLLIFSLGNFIIQSRRDFAVAVPDASVKAFVVFVIGQIFVQIAGHVDIFYNQHVSGEAYKASVANHAVSHAEVIGLYTFGNTALAMSILSMSMIERYLGRVYDALWSELKEKAAHHEAKSNYLLKLSIASLVTVIISAVLITFRYKDKLTISTIALSVEFLIFVLTIDALGRERIKSALSQIWGGDGDH